MHEVARAESVRETVQDAVRAQGARAVGVVRIEIGPQAQVELEAMRFAFEVGMQGSLGHRARLDKVHTAGTAWRTRCAEPVAIGQRGQPCRLCGSHQLQVAGGDRPRVLEIEMH
jgi:hydrogenase nickel incorporation protein HypA/HybF